MRSKCSLALSNGEVFEGELIGAPVRSSGELVFTTAMVGYGEALTDPSYFGQILLFSYPLIGNYGVPPIPSSLELPIPTGIESSKIHASAVLISIDSPSAFHWKSFQSLDSWLKSQNVPGIMGLDTRHLVHMIRSNPCLMGKIEMSGSSATRMLGELDPFACSDDGFFDPAKYNIVSQVSTKERIILGSGRKRIGLIDFGVKWNIIRQLVGHECEVEIFPWDTPISEMDCSGWLLSNGPGDPNQTGDSVARIRALLERSQPVLGICLGHQILSLAAGMKTRRMPFGHRSHNQPVYEVGTRKGSITSQNHGYVVEDDVLPDGWEIWFRNANDQTVEGIRHKNKPFRGVQFHPESAGGPRDTGEILDQFVSEVLNS
ncbi:MAG: glutamine-hydrolyzing carbamoyl-phosphate synthase small subunit [Bdellovibrionota bacterium]